MTKDWWIAMEELILQNDINMKYVEVGKEEGLYYSLKELQGKLEEIHREAVERIEERLRVKSHVK